MDERLDFVRRPRPRVKLSRREVFAREGTLAVTKADRAKDPHGKYQLYYTFSTPAARLPTR